MSAIAVPATTAPRSGWRQLLGFNLLSGILLGIGGWYLGHFIGGRITGANLTYYSETAGQNDIAIFLGYLLGVVGFLIGLGFANYPLKRLIGHPPSLAERESESLGLYRYFTLSTDHKVVAKQYMVGIGLFFFVGGLNAMLIRTELLQPNVHVFGANQYLTLVGMHGSMMMGIMTSGILGPFANWLVPIMIGSRRMAFPRIESFTFWLLMAGSVILITTIFFGGFQTGWTGYQPLGAQNTAGYDAYIGFFALVGVSMMLFGFNLIATIITMRAPGMTWSRLPIFVWATFATATLMLLAAPMLIAALLMGAMDRTVQTTFFIAGAGGSAYLFQNLFWVFGHPEVYVLALPGMGIVLELLPVFSRKPLWGYRLAVAGLLGIAFLSFFVWQHHLFVSGINADLRPFYMLSTELISLPTGFIFLCAMGTLWRGRIRLTVPMLFCLAWIFNFLWGGISGVFNSDVPSDITTHGSFFVMAHFHYTIMGGLIFAFFAAIYYWVPKMYGYKLNEKLGKVHFWVMFIAFNATFAPLFGLGFMGMPRRVVTYSAGFQGLNDWVSVSAYVLGLSMLVFIFNVVWSLAIKREPAEPNPWHSKSTEWQLPTPVPVHDFNTVPVFDQDPYPYGVEEKPSGVPSAVPAGGST
ncbi:MAG TPA: cbb3-type cytochrome c oxidase subunit I [Solirubrobacteraceae bacterium]|jgi:cytochrome c oxidase subunit 1